MNNNNYPVQERYEDEIDLVDLIKKLIKGKYIILFTTVTIMLLGIIFSIFQRNQSYQATTFLKFALSNSTSQINLIRSPAVIERVQSNFPILQDKGISIEDIRQGIAIDGIIPNNIQKRIDEGLKTGEEFSYTPNIYKISLRLTKDKKLDRLILNNLISEYRRYYDFRFNQNDIIGLLNANSKDYEYIELIDIVNRRIALLEEEIEPMLNSSFRSLEYQMTYSDLLRDLKLFKNSDIQLLSAIIRNNNLNRDRDRLLVRYRNELRNLNLDKAKAESEREALNTILKNYKPESSQFILSGIDGNLSENREATYYSRLIERATEAGIRNSNLNEEIKYIENKILEINNSSLERQELISRADDLSESIILKLNDLISQTNSMNSEYRNIKFSNKITKITPVDTLWESNVKIVAAISIVLGLFLGVFLVFLLEFKKNLLEASN